MSLRDVPIKDSYKGILNLNNTNGELTLIPQSIKDGVGNSSPISISLDSVYINTGINAYKLPSSAGTQGQMLLSNGPGGFLYWATVENTGFTEASADAKYQPIGSYLDQATADTLYLSANTPIGESIDLSGYITEASVISLFSEIEGNWSPVPQKVAKLTTTSSIAIPSNSVIYLPFNTIDFDTGGFVVPTPTSSQLVVPSGVNKVRLDAGYGYALDPGTNNAEFGIKHVKANGGDVFSIAFARDYENGWGAQTISTGVVSCNPGDMFGLWFWSSDAVSLRTSGTFFSIQDITTNVIINQTISGTSVDLSGYATESFVSNSISQLEFATSAYVDQQIASISFGLSEASAQTMINEAVSGITVGSIDLSGYLTEASAQILINESVSGLASINYVNQQLALVSGGGAVGSSDALPLSANETQTMYHQRVNWVVSSALTIDSSASFYGRTGSISIGQTYTYYLSLGGIGTTLRFNGVTWPTNMTNGSILICHEDDSYIGSKNLTFMSLTSAFTRHFAGQVPNTISPSSAQSLIDEAVLNNSGTNHYDSWTAYSPPTSAHVTFEDSIIDPMFTFDAPGAVIVDSYNEYDDTPTNKALQLRNVGDNESTWVEFKIVIGTSGGLSGYPNTIYDWNFNLWWKINSEYPGDVGRIYIDEIFKEEQVGDNGWVQYGEELTPGEHVVKLEYIKDESGSVPIDNIRLGRITWFREDPNNVAYRHGDTVDHNNKRWMCITPGTREEPGTGSDWLDLTGEYEVLVSGPMTGVMNYYFRFQSNTHSTSISTSTYAMKGLIVRPKTNVALSRISFSIDPASTSEIFQAYVYRYADDPTIDATVTHVWETNELQAVGTTQTYYWFDLPEIVHVNAGEYYGIVCVVKSGTTSTALRVPFPGSGSAGDMDIGNLERVGVIRDTRLDVNVNDIVTPYDSTGYVYVGIYGIEEIDYQFPYVTKSQIIGGGDIEVRLSGNQVIVSGNAGTGGSVDLSGYATIAYVDQAVSGLSGGSVDLSGYLTETSADSKYQPIGNYLDQATADTLYLSANTVIGAGTIDWADIQNKPVIPGAQPFQGALIRATSDQLYTNTGIYDAIRFDEVSYDTSGYWSAAAPNRFTVPTGVTKVKLTAAIKTSGTTVGTDISLQFSKNGSVGFVGNPSITVDWDSYNNPGVNLTSSVLEVSAGDYFELAYFIGGDMNINGSRNQTWFSIETVERTYSAAGVNGYLDNLIDVSAPSPQDGQALLWNSSTSEWQPGTPIVAANAAQGMYKPFKGALVISTVDRSHDGSLLPVVWDSAEYDTNNFWSAGSPGRFTIPTGVTKIRLHTTVKYAVNTFTTSAGDSVVIQFAKNGSTAWYGSGITAPRTGYNDGGFTIISPVVPVQAGDFFEVRVNNSKTGNTTILANISCFSIEVVEAEETLP